MRQELQHNGQMQGYCWLQLQAVQVHLNLLDAPPKTMDGMCLFLPLKQSKQKSRLLLKQDKLSFYLCFYGVSNKDMERCFFLLGFTYLYGKMGNKIKTLFSLKNRIEFLNLYTEMDYRHKNPCFMGPFTLIEYNIKGIERHTPELL